MEKSQRLPEGKLFTLISTTRIKLKKPRWKFMERACEDKDQKEFWMTLKQVRRARATNFPAFMKADEEGGGPAITGVEGILNHYTLINNYWFSRKSKSEVMLRQLQKKLFKNNFFL